MEKEVIDFFSYIETKTNFKIDISSADEIKIKVASYSKETGSVIYSSVVSYATIISSNDFSFIISLIYNPDIDFNKIEDVELVIRDERNDKLVGAYVQYQLRRAVPDIPVYITPI